MKNELTCEVVQDLLPSYVDHLTSDITNTAIVSHVKNCEDCRRILAAMQAPESLPEKDPADASTIDFLKKNRKKNRNRILASVLTVALLLSGFWGWKVYISPRSMTDTSTMNYSVTVTDSKKIQIKGSLTDHSLGVSGINYTVDADNPGIVTINVRANRLSASKNNTFSDETTEKHKIEKVYVNDWIAWENGTAIQPKAAQIYNTIHPYVGSMSDNGKTLTALGINDVLPIATHELQTTDEPYGWTMNLDGSFKKSQQTELERTMKNYAMVILVCTENLGSVTFSYSLDGQKTDFTYTKEQGEEDFRGTCAYFRNSATEFQALLAKAGILNTVYSSLSEGGYRLTEAITKVVDAEITGSVRDEKDTFIQQYKTYQPINSWSPGSVYKSFSSEDEALAYIGYDKLKPIKLPQTPEHVEVTALGDRSGNICYISFLESYSCENADLSVSASADIYTEHSTISDYVDIDYPSNMDDSSIYTTEDYTSASGETWKIITTTNASDDSYDSIDAYQVKDTISYRIGISYPGDQKNKARATLLELLK